MELNKQSVVITPAVEEVREDRYVLTLTREEIELLTVLVDYPLHHKQSEKVYEGLGNLAGLLWEIQDEMGYQTPESYGFTNNLNLGDLS